MHKRLEAIKQELVEEHRRRVEALEWADDAIERAGIAGLLERGICNLVAARPNWGGGNLVNIFVAPEAKSEVMQILTDSNIEKWRRSKLLTYTDLDGEGLRNWLYSDFDHWDGDNRITVRFATPVQEGDEVEGCVIKRTEHAVGRLTLSCDR